RFEREAVANDAGLQVEIEQHRDQRILKARDDDDLVDELVFVAPHAAQPLPHRLLFLRREIVDDQQLEVRAIDPYLGLAPLFFLDRGFFVEMQRNKALPVGLARKRATDAVDEVIEVCVFAVLKQREQAQEAVPSGKR